MSSSTSFWGTVPHIHRYLSVQTLKNPSIYSCCNSKWTDTSSVHFYAHQTIRNRPATSDRTRQSMIRCVHACTDLAKRVFRAFAVNKYLTTLSNSTRSTLQGGWPTFNHARAHMRPLHNIERYYLSISSSPTHCIRNSYTMTETWCWDLLINT